MHRQRHTEVCGIVNNDAYSIHNILFRVVNLQDVRKSLAELREGLAKIRKELAEYFTDVEQNDRYGKQMWSFVGKASAQLEDLVDDVNHAESTFSEVVSYYGEDEKNMGSAEFYGIFKTFVTSYRVREYSKEMMRIFTNI